MQQVFFVLVAAAICAITLPPRAAQAQTRVFVGAQGADSNPCTFTQPCRTLQKAHDTLPIGGEIDVLDPAGYGTLTINKAISIQGHGFAGIAAPSGDAITVNAAATDTVSLRGLLIDGIGTGQNGMTFNSGGTLDVQDCVIRNFTGSGIAFVPANSSALFVSRTHIASIVSFGMIVSPLFASGTVQGELNQIEVMNLNANGINFSPSASAVLKFTVSESLVARALNNGIVVGTNGSATATVMVRNSTIANNTNHGLVTVGAGARLQMTDNAVSGNGIGIAALPGSNIDSFGDNYINGNGTDGTPTNTIANE